MKHESASEKLANDILLLQAKKIGEMRVLKEQVHIIYESIRPINLIKNTLKEATEIPDLKDGLSKAAIGMASGYILKKILFGTSINPLKNIASAAFQSIVTNVVAKNANSIKEKGYAIIEHVKDLFMSSGKKQ